MCKVTVFVDEDSLAGCPAPVGIDDLTVRDGLSKRSDVSGIQQDAIDGRPRAGGTGRNVVATGISRDGLELAKQSVTLSSFDNRFLKRIFANQGCISDLASLPDDLSAESFAN